jgi:hypothetical protein
MSKLTELEIMLQQFDYRHDHSDDHDYWLKVDQSKSKISELLKELYSSNTTEIDSMFKLYWNSQYINWKKYFKII